MRIRSWLIKPIENKKKNIERKLKKKIGKVYLKTFLCSNRKLERKRTIIGLEREFKETIKRNIWNQLGRKKLMKKWLKKGKCERKDCNKKK